MAYLFGPVPSRRYGRSLGIDLVPMKTCCYDCIFCQLGRTPRITCERRDYVPIDAVIAELEIWLSRNEQVDIFTLCGSGEPTLHLHFGEVLQWLQKHVSYPTLLMSNGALFADPTVRRDAALADRVKISLHFWDEESFRTIVRPDPLLHFSDIYAGWKQFRALYSGKLDVEFFALPGINDSPDQINKIFPLIEQLHPDTVTVNSAERPPADSCVRPVPLEELTTLKRLFSVIATEQHTAVVSTPEPYSETALLELVRRHPLSPEQFSRYFDVPVECIREVLKRHSKEDPYVARALLNSMK